MSWIKKIYIIAHPEHEKKQIEYLASKMEPLGISFEFRCKTWKDRLHDVISPHEIHLYKYGYSGITSLLLNQIDVFETIVKNNTDGNFLVLESDAIFHDKFLKILEYIGKYVGNLNPQFDMIDLSDGCNLKPPSWCHTHNIQADGHLYQAIRDRTTCSIVFTYKCVKRILDIIKQPSYRFIYPVDHQIYYFVRNHHFIMYWLYPHIITQGSQNGVYKTNIQGGSGFNMKTLENLNDSYLEL